MNILPNHSRLSEIRNTPIDTLSEPALHDFTLLEPKYLRTLPRERIEAIAHRSKTQLPEVYRFCVRNFGIDMFVSGSSESTRFQHWEDILHYLRVSQFEIHEHALAQLQQLYAEMPLVDYLSRHRWRAVMKRLLRDSKRPQQNLVPAYTLSHEEVTDLCEYVRSELSDEKTFQQKEYDLAMGYARLHDTRLLKRTLECVRKSLSHRFTREYARSVRWHVSSLR